MNRLIVEFNRSPAVAAAVVITLTLAATATASVPIVVRDSGELQAALVGENAGRLVLVQPGQYPVGAPLVVPDGMTIQGAGVMLGGERPSGFQPRTLTRIYAAAPFAGDLMSLGDGVTLKGLVIEHAAGAFGNAVNVASRAPADVKSVTVLACEIISPNPSGIGPAGPTGEGIALVAGNPNLGADPPPHEGSQIDLTMIRSIVRAEAGGAALFAINFASRSLTTIVLQQNVVAGSVRLVGGVSRPDAVEQAGILVRSIGNLYSGETLAVQLPGWQIYGGGTVPVPLPAGETTGNTVRFVSRQDSLTGFQRAVLAAGGARNNLLPGAASGNRVDLRLQQLTLSTPDNGLSTDLSLHGALSSVASSAGEGNELTVLAAGVKGSGYRGNVYSSTTVQGVPNVDDDNVLTFFGTAEHFDLINQDVLPAPDAGFFSGTPH